MCAFRLTRGSQAIIAICLLDMVTTLILVKNGLATEFNPIMQVFLSISPFAFVLAKLISFVPFVVAIEVYKRYNPRFTSCASRIAVIAYLFIYVTLTVGINI